MLGTCPASQRLVLIQEFPKTCLEKAQEHLVKRGTALSVAVHPDIRSRAL